MTNKNATVECWYFTFSRNHQHAQGYVKIEGNYLRARELMFERFGTDWAFQYPSAEKAGVEEFKLYEVTE